MTQKILTLQKKWAVLMIVLMLAGNLTAGCSSHSHSYKSTTKNVDGETVVVEKQETQTSESHDHGILGGAFHVVGEVLAFPFDVIAGLFRFIF